jgi:hypothetical protein
MSSNQRPLLTSRHRSIAAGQNTTYFIAAPNEAMSELPRHPVMVESPELCVRCSEEKGEDEIALECEKVRLPSTVQF